MKKPPREATRKGQPEHLYSIPLHQICQMEVSMVNDELMECLNKLNGIDRYKVLVYARVLVKIQEEKNTAEV